MNTTATSVGISLYKKEAGLFKALAHPARLALLDVLSQGEACVCHLTALLRLRQPYISQQLMVLRRAGLILPRRDGTVIYYRLALPQVPELVEAARALLRARGVEGTRLTLPDLPLPGCSCPLCTMAALSFSGPGRQREPEDN